MKRKKKAAVFCLALVLLFGCQRKANNGSIIVNHITVTYEHNGQILQQEYSAPEAMRTILVLIRMLGDRGRANEDPETLPGQSFRLVMTHTDGSQKVFCSKENRFVRDGNGPWQQVHPDRLSRLHRVLQNLPGDSDKPLRHVQFPRYIPSVHSNDFEAVFHCFQYEELLT